MDIENTDISRGYIIARMRMHFVQEGEKKPIMLMHCWMKLDGQNKWAAIANSIKTTTIAKMMEKFEVIMAKEEAAAKHNEVKEEKKVERFGIFMDMQEKKIKPNSTFY